MLLFPSGFGIGVATKWGRVGLFKHLASTMNMRKNGITKIIFFISIFMSGACSTGLIVGSDPAPGVPVSQSGIQSTLENSSGSGLAKSSGSGRYQTKHTVGSTFSNALQADIRNFYVVE